VNSVVCWRNQQKWGRGSHFVFACAYRRGGGGRCVRSRFSSFGVSPCLNLRRRRKGVVNVHTGLEEARAELKTESVTNNHNL